MAGKSPEEVQRAVEIYQQELSKLQQKMAAAKQEEDSESKDTKRPLGLPPPPPPAPLPTSSKSAAEERPLGSSPAALAAASAPPPPPPGPVPPPAGAPPPGDASPLQGMASITNSLTTQPLHAPYRPAQRSYKAVLPPITQEQFDRYENLNTEDLVKRVRKSVSYANREMRPFYLREIWLSGSSCSSWDTSYFS